jgi:nanoRNase/pAp phosphatase (c-di-AMP/oligoRNAs hydrolase)
VKPVVLYHGGCRDGFCAAWCVPGPADFVPVFYGKAPPEEAFSGRPVVIVDFSYPRDVLTAIADAAESLLVLDHHKTAQADLEGFAHPKASIHFDMNRSGAGMAWDHFHHGLPRPWMVDYVEDRDLWRHVLPESEAINAFLGTVKFDFESWTRCLAMTAAEARASGAAVHAKIEQYVAEVAKNAILVLFDGHVIPLVNAPQVDVSELLSKLAEGHPFSMGWWQMADGRFSYGLRSREPSTIDVSEIAKRHGGGGHARAAGFQSPCPGNEITIRVVP